ncbi:unnamed protein product [Schistosoma haematobium]|nr:unnamed protein product [Schistosoma haematobium]
MDLSIKEFAMLNYEKLDNKKHLVSHKIHSKRRFTNQIRLFKEYINTIFLTTLISKKMLLFIALMVVLGSLLQNSFVEVHGRSSLNAPERLFEGVYNASVEQAKEKVNKTEMKLLGRR